ncbi:MAG: 30S ribosomal protein S7 [Candidatus Harrisonbacteria bacterium CG10_big_fil_rev_8_21_14_0_10_44_23]|uniref:Small ribosomal subunit protein uS7 n=1 Tax=Candidatus Harrisonbacteria bacterium CG10_big_fil_rev_8_21_14_0_10_44_23 TaxID=1974585 RepID=A0A2H0UPZ1_9BACT|nr:MAG: 30S ribosomal protein S7 [Candidatus Harrisonbacteria bacterium CG10_big_fil_rev_8_21_14_0_10_44_23]
MRKKRNYSRPYTPDIKHDNVAIGRFINVLMKDGNKAKAEKVFYDAFDIIEKKSKEKPLEVFEKALENAMPVIEVVRKRVGGANYQVPAEVRPERRFMLAVRWLVAAAKSRGGHTMAEKIAQELIEAAKNEGSAIKKKQDVHKMAEANRAFAHFNR